jgi:hypothetical protein
MALKGPKPPLGESDSIKEKSAKQSTAMTNCRDFLLLSLSFAAVALHF